MSKIEKKKSSDRAILAVGSLAFDSIKTPSGKVDKILGGSVNYFSISSSFFVNLNLVGVVGKDFPKEHFSVLENRGIDLTGIEISEGKTFHWEGEYGSDLNEAKTIATHLNVFETFNPKVPEAYKNSNYLFLANIDPVIQQAVYNQIKAPKLVAADLMNFWITSKKDELLKTLKLVDLLTINEGEAFQLSGKDNIVEAAETIRSMGPQALVVKRGEYGALLFTKHGVFSAPALPMATVKDPTGAGDTFAGGMIGYLAHEGITRQDLEKSDEALRRAIIFGCVMASFTVEDFGFKQLLKIHPEQAEQRYQLFLKMTKF